MTKAKQVLKTTTVENDEKRMEVYRTAAQIFYEKGFNATSVGDIADAMGFTKATLYYYIESKQDLLFVIMNLGLDALEQDVIIPAREIADAEKRLVTIIHHHARQIAAGNHAVTIISDEVKALSDAQREKIIVRRRMYLDFLRLTLDQLKAEGKLHDLDTKVAAFSIVGMILWMARWYHPNDRLTPEEVSREISKLAFNALLHSTSDAAKRIL